SQATLSTRLEGAECVYSHRSPAAIGTKVWVDQRFHFCRFPALPTKRMVAVETSVKTSRVPFRKVKASPSIALRARASSGANLVRIFTDRRVGADISQLARPRRP